MTQGKGTGRKPLRSFRCGDPEWQTIVDAAAVSGQTQSEIVREGALARARRLLSKAARKTRHG